MKGEGEYEEIAGNFSLARGKGFGGFPDWFGNWRKTFLFAILDLMFLKKKIGIICLGKFHK